MRRLFFFVKQKTAYERRISDWSSDVCSSDLGKSAISPGETADVHPLASRIEAGGGAWRAVFIMQFLYVIAMIDRNLIALMVGPIKQSLQISDFQVSLLQGTAFGLFYATCGLRSEEHTSELQSLMRISYAVFCLKKKKISKTNT